MFLEMNYFHTHTHTKKVLEPSVKQIQYIWILLKEFPGYS